MKSIGELVAKANAAAKLAAAAPTNLPAEPRLHRVSISYVVFAELTFEARDGREARAKAMANVKHAKRRFRTEPFSYRTEVCAGKDAATGKLLWTEVDAPGRA